MISFFTPSRIQKGLFFFLLTILCYNSVSAQATLSLQGILKKANGVAFEDGEYTITFKMYAVDGSPAGVLWSETQTDVEVISGIYSVVLGEVTAINIPFDQDYELGVTVGSQEMLPRAKLTSAPYALSLRGETNQFPSTGQVSADEIKVADGILVSSGTPGTNGADKNGYAFNNDKATGMFSTTNGQLDFYSNEVKKMQIYNSGVYVDGGLIAKNLNLGSDGNFYYSTAQGTHTGWRLADVDDIQNGNSQGWNSYAPLAGEELGWNQPNPVGACPQVDFGDFIGYVLKPSDNNHVIKKQFTIAGSFSQIKVKFRYYFIDTWDPTVGEYDLAFAGFSSAANGNNFRIAYVDFPPGLNNNGAMDNVGSTIASTINFYEQTNVGDFWKDVEMSANFSSNNFWVFIGAALNHGTNNEGFAVSNIEVWVK